MGGSTSSRRAQTVHWATGQCQSPQTPSQGCLPSGSPEGGRGGEGRLVGKAQRGPRLLPPPQWLPTRLGPKPHQHVASEVHTIQEVHTQRQNTSFPTLTLSVLGALLPSWHQACRMQAESQFLKNIAVCYLFPPPGSPGGRTADRVPRNRAFRAPALLGCCCPLAAQVCNFQGALNNSLHLARLPLLCVLSVLSVSPSFPLLLHMPAFA